MSQLLFRNATSHDLNTLNEVAMAAKRHWQYPEAWIKAWENDLKLKDTDLTQLHIRVLEVEDSIIGFCAIQTHPQYYEVTDLWILPSHMGKGLGAKLLENTLLTGTADAKKVMVESDPNARGFYERQGFVLCGWKESYPKGRYLPILERQFKARQ